MWYVIQVTNGREDVMRERIERMMPAGVMQELFYPQFQTEIKVHGGPSWASTRAKSSMRSRYCCTVRGSGVSQIR